MTATRPHPITSQTGDPLTAQGCRCIGHEPFGDKRDGTCATCGRQVDGKEMPTTNAARRSWADLPAGKRRSYGPAQ